MLELADDRFCIVALVGGLVCQDLGEVTALGSQPLLGAEEHGAGEVDGDGLGRDDANDPRPAG